jgi:hypothetical protein
MTAPLLSYVTMHRWFVAMLIVTAVLWLIVELREWRTRAKHLRAKDRPWRDPRDAQRRDEEARKQRPSRFA